MAAVTVGLFAGLLALVMSSVVVVYLHLPPIGVLHVERVDELAGLALFAGGGLVVATVGSIARRDLTPHNRSDLDEAIPTLKLTTSAPPPLLSAKRWRQLQPVCVETLLEPLTTREIEVLEAVAAGMSNEDIATSLYISVNTVKSHLKSVYGKLQVASRTQAVTRGIALGIVEVPVGPQAQPGGQIAA